MRAGNFILFFLIAHLNHGQNFQYTVRNYKPADGLPQSQVRAMLEDKFGYLWIGTEGGGLAQFDGRSFKVYTTRDGLQSNIVSHLKFDRNDNLWIVHPRGLTRFDGVSFKKFEQPGLKLNASRLTNLVEYNDTIFFLSAPGHEGKIYRDSVYYWNRPFYKGRESGEKLIKFMRQAKDGTVVYCINQQALFFRTAKGEFWVPYGNHFQIIKNIFEYQNTFWLQTDNGYMSVDMENQVIRKESLPVQNIILQYDSSHAIFWTKDMTHVFKETLVNNVVKIDTVLRDVDIAQVLLDAEGNTWLGSNAQGLFKYFIQDFDKCTSDKMGTVMAISADKSGSRWIGTGNKGLWKIRNGKISSYQTPDARLNGFFTIKESRTGDLWVGSTYGLGKYDVVSDKFVWLKPNSQSRFNGIISIQFDEQNGMWLGMMGGGLNYYDGQIFKNFSVYNGLNTNWITALLYLPENKTLYVGDEFGLSSIYEGKVVPLAIEGLENTSVLSMSLSGKSTLLVSTGGLGLLIYNPLTRFSRYITSKEGLPSDFIYFTAQDNEGYLWIGSEKGITRLRLNERYDVIENIHFDHENGLAGVEANQNAYFIEGRNRYFGLIDGLYQFNGIPRSAKKFYGVHLTKVDLSYGEFLISDYADSTYSFFKLAAHPVLPPDKNHITFYFNRVDKSYPKSVKFKYILEGFDNTWSQSSSLSQVTYGNLPPGNYTFKVRSTDHTGGWTDGFVCYPLTIQSPFYKTIWFYAVCFVLSGLLILLILFFRVRQRVNRVMMLQRFREKEQENLRRNIARDFHDEMGNQLSRIINYISLLRLNSYDVNGNNSHDLYNKVEDSAKYLYTGTRDFIWSIDPGNDELSKLFIHIRDFGEKLFEEKNINFRAYNEVKDKVKLPYGFSREANLIFKEIMTNAFKYSNAFNVSFTLKRTDDLHFEFCFQDDGIGFQIREDDQNRRGLNHIQERSDKINGNVVIESKPGEGTKIILKFKIENKVKTYGITL